MTGLVLGDEARRAIDAGALVVVNDSGGKDSAAQGILLSRVVPPEQRVHVHATLGESEWPGALDKAREHAAHLGAGFAVVQAQKSFLELVAHRFAKRPDAPSWPSPQFRLCTSDLKTSVITKWTIAYARERGYTRVINALGLRAEESRNRAAKSPCAEVPRLTIAPRTLKDGTVRPGRQWLNVLPIHGLPRDEVFGTIADAGLAPHAAYGLGNDRLSCSLCFFASQCDLRNGARHHPVVYQKYAAMEVLTGWAMSPSRKFLPELTGVPLNRDVVEAYRGDLLALAAPGPLTRLGAP